MKKKTTLRISASLGVSSADETGNYDFEQLQPVADARLYQAKQSGRNRVVWRIRTGNDPAPPASPQARAVGCDKPARGYRPVA